MLNNKEQSNNQDQGIVVHGVANGYSEMKDILVENKPRTAIMLRPHMSKHGIGATLIRYRKGKSDNRKDVTQIKFNTLHEGDSIKIRLSHEATAILIKNLNQCCEMYEQCGYRPGNHRYVSVDRDALIINDANKAAVIEKLLDAGVATDFLKKLSEENGELAAQFADAEIQSHRRKSLAQFQEMLDNDTLAEPDWQKFFEDNQWIFGYGLRYQFVSIDQSQPRYGGGRIDGKGDEKGDFLGHSVADIKYTCLVEIKKPSTLLLSEDKYRNGTYAISRELAGAVAQMQANSTTWEIEGSRTDGNRDKLEGNGIYTVSPKSIVIIGNTKELAGSRDKIKSFELFRQNLRSPEVITFDELFERAKFIVDGSERQ